MASTARFSSHPLALAIALTLSLPTLAQQAPDAGRVQQQLTPRQIAPSRQGPVIAMPAGLPDAALPGGATVTVTALRFSGNTALSDEVLAAALADAAGKRYDMAGLKALAARVLLIYQAAGYPFARAYLPQQSLNGGELSIAIVEGRYGQIEAGELQAWLRDIRPGAVIELAPLERATLVLGDLPGVELAPLMRPGQELGTGDLILNAQRKPRLGGDVSLDNQGNRYTGSYRASVGLHYDSPFTWGDQVTARLQGSDGKQWLGALGYSIPVGATGLRAQLGYSHTAYELGQDFAKLHATGTAKTSSLGLSYPLVRSQVVNVSLAGSFQHKALNDKNGLAAKDDDKSSNSLALTLSFDRRDGLGGGGVSYGALAFTGGQLMLNGPLSNADSSSGRNTRGRYDKLTLDLARVQATVLQDLSLFGRFSAQWAGKNLDSSESFSVGGAGGVRAYPQGEGTGDGGWLVQAEARYQMAALAPYAFVDAGRVNFNANNLTLTYPANPNHRHLAGAGLGLRYSDGPFSLDANLAWQAHGGAPTSDTRSVKPRAWLVGKYSF